MNGIKLEVTNLKELVALADKLGIDLEGKNQEQVTQEVEAKLFGTTQAPHAPVIKPAVQAQAAPQPTVDQIVEQGKNPLIDAVLKSEDTNAEKIRQLMGLGLTKGKIAKLLDVKYQQVYQVEQRMLEEAAKAN